MRRGITIALLCAFTRVAGQAGFFASASWYDEIEGRTSVNTVQAGYHLFANRPLYAGAQVAAVKFWSAANSSAGAGAGVSAGVAIIRLPVLRVCFEASGGVLRMFPDFRTGALNYQFSIGPVLELPLTRGCVLKSALSAYHFSNGNRDGQSRNDTWDGAGLTLGIIF